MHRPRFLDRMATELGDQCAFTSRFARGQRPFQPDHVEPKWARDRVADVGHVSLDIVLDFDARTIAGTARHHLSAIIDDLREVQFDASEMTVSAVRVAEEPVAFEHEGGKLTVRLSSPLGSGEEAEVAIDYSARPRRGLYFVGPDEAHPDKPIEAWTQGEDEDSRYWFPCYDYPNDRVTSEVIATVPEKFTAVSNGGLLATTSDSARRTRTFHWRHDVPHSVYLISLAVGEFVEIRESAGETPVLYYVRPGREDDARRAFGNTPRMIQFFERRIGVPYPYAKYSQVAVTDFIFGGMENTSATTQTADTLHDERAHLDFSSDPLVAHELAHQWWGDLLTCRDWSHAWLNEGFATYFEALWCEEDKGADEFAWNLRQDREGYLAEASHRYRRPIVCNRYRVPIELFDRHLYEKGSLVLHMLRRELGDTLFFKALNLYCTRNRGQNVITQDLQHAFEQATGRNLDWFFDQWVYKEGHPEIEVSHSFDDKQKLLGVTVNQTHKISDGVSRAFRLSATIALTHADGRETGHRVEVTQRQQTFHFVCAAAPKAVSFDPAHDILKTLKHKRSREVLELILGKAPEAIARSGAAFELGREGSPQAVVALRDAMLNDPFWGVQADAATALGQAKTSEAKAALLEGLSLEHPKARRAVVRALGAFRNDSEAADALARVLGQGDPSYFVEAEAALALGKTRDPAAFEHLCASLNKDSYLEVIRAHTFAGMGELRDDRAMDVAREWCHYGNPVRARVAALGTIGRCAELSETRRTEAVDFLLPFVDDPDFMVRLRLPGVFEDIGDARAVAPLRRLGERELDGRIRRRTEEAIDSIVQGRSRIEEGTRLREEMHKLREDNAKLRERVDKLEASTRGNQS